MGFIKYDQKYLNKAMAKLRPLPMTNILVVGEVGSEKSRWINSLNNYLSYSTIADAEKGQLLCLIEEKINDISDQSQEESRGIQDLRDPKPISYFFKTRNVILRLIDSPGLGDGRGESEDDMHMESSSLYGILRWGGGPGRLGGGTFSLEKSKISRFFKLENFQKC